MTQPTFFTLCLVLLIIGQWLVIFVLVEINRHVREIRNQTRHIENEITFALRNKENRQ